MEGDPQPRTQAPACRGCAVYTFEPEATHPELTWCPSGGLRKPPLDLQSGLLKTPQPQRSPPLWVAERGRSHALTPPHTLPSPPSAPPEPGALEGPRRPFLPGHGGDPLRLSCCCSLVARSRPTLCDPADCGPPGSSIHGILQSRTLEWVAVSSSRGTSQPTD